MHGLFLGKLLLSPRHALVEVIEQKRKRRSQSEHRLDHEWLCLRVETFGDLRADAQVERVASKIDLNKILE